MIWLSIDPATTSGLARWDGSTLVSTTVCKPVGKSGWTLCADGRKMPKAPELTVWRTALSGCEVAVLELPRGASRTADASLAARRGYIRAVCEMVGCQYVELELSTWRRAIADEMRERGTPVTWTSGDDTKRQARACVATLYGRASIGEDEADAVLIGHAALRLRLIDLGGE